MISVMLVGPTAPIEGVVIVAAESRPDGPTLVRGAESIDAALGGRLLAGYRAAGGVGAADDVVKIATLGLADFELVVVVGLGAADVPRDPENLRRAVGAAARALGARPAVHIAIDDADLVGAITEGALFGDYRFTRFKSKPAPAPSGRLAVATADPGSEAAQQAVRRAVVLADAVHRARDLVNRPPNDLYPESFADEVVSLASVHGLEVEVLDEPALQADGYGGVLAVGGGSVRPPRVVRVGYRAGVGAKKVALVGKGITFDSGGLNLKTQHQTWMKSDMGGAAAVIAAVVAVAELGLAVDVVATVPMAENLPSGSAYRPSDIITLRDGTTVEIGDTDAEGRIVLADAITRAVDDEPDYLIEVSTLTGAQLVALGPRVIAAMGSDDLRDRITEVGVRAGEPIWAMPLPSDIRRGLDSPVADLVNVPSERWGSMLAGGSFLAEFVPSGLPWVHLDIAGPAWNFGSAHGYTPKGGTGAATRTLVAMIESIAADG